MVKRILSLKNPERIFAICLCKMEIIQWKNKSLNNSIKCESLVQQQLAEVFGYENIGCQQKHAYKP